MRAVLGAFLLPAAALAGCAEAEPARRPDVILISLDTLRADHLGLYGYERDTSPYLDRLAEECVVFDNAYTTAAWTLVAHMSMLTGLYPRQHGVHHGEQALNPATPLLAERLRVAGYQTVGLYFRSWVHPRHGFDRGFDVFREHADVEEAGAHLREELARLDPARPFFLFVHLFDVHSGRLTDGPGPVYDTPAPYDELFLEAPATRLAHRTETEIWNATDLPAAEIEALVALYDGGIRRVDAELEGWIEGWRAEGRLDRALLIVTADHGEGLGQRGNIKGHGTVFQEGLRVPLLVRLPAAEDAGRRVAEVVSLVDIVPTVLASADLAPGELGGSSLFEPLAERTVLAYQELGTTRETGLRWPHKIAHTGKGKTLGVHLEEDPLELRPRRVDLAELERWRESVLGPPAELARWPAPIPARLAQEDLDELRALGYGGEDE